MTVKYSGIVSDIMLQSDTESHFCNFYTNQPTATSPDIV